MSMNGDLGSSRKLRTVVVFPEEWTYSIDADAFVRQVCRECAGWRRDEWAYSPLFIWVENPPKTRGTEGRSGGPEANVFLPQLAANEEDGSTAGGNSERG